MLKLCRQNHRLWKYLIPNNSLENLIHELVSFHYLLLTISLTLSMAQESELYYIHMIKSPNSYLLTNLVTLLIG